MEAMGGRVSSIGNRMGMRIPRTQSQHNLFAMGDARETTPPDRSPPGCTQDRVVLMPSGVSVDILLNQKILMRAVNISRVGVSIGSPQATESAPRNPMHAGHPTIAGWSSW